LSIGLSHYGGAEGQAVDQRMERKTERQAQPTKRMLSARRLVMVIMAMMLIVARPFMIMIVAVFILHIARITVLVSVHVKHADQEEHREQPAERPTGQPIDRTLLRQGMRHQVQEGDAEHQAADEAHHELHPAVRQANPTWQRSAQQ
jgi:hypothetical protein